jgi:predicted outer membrane repeat protein
MRALPLTALLTACSAAPSALPMSEVPPLASCTPGVAAVSLGVGYPTIQDAIDASISPATIEVCPGTWYENLIMPPGAWQLRGFYTSGSAGSIIDGSSAGSVIRAGITGALSVDTLILKNGDDTFGGAIYSPGSDVYVEDSVLVNNSAGSGGAITSINGYVYITDTTFQDNTSTAGDGCGGAIHLLANPPNQPDLWIQGSTFVDNAATNTGGAICATTIDTGAHVDLRVVDTTLDHNSATRGAGIMAETIGSWMDVTITGSSFTDNDGGAVYLRTSPWFSPNQLDAEIEGTLFDLNTALDGPALMLAGLDGLLTTALHASTVTRNTATSGSDAAIWAAVDAFLELWNVNMGTGANDNVTKDFFACPNSYGANTTGIVRPAMNDRCP